MENITEDHTENKVDRSLRHQYKAKLISYRLREDEEDLIDLNIRIRGVRKYA
jgi:hypothetical protein